MPLVVISRNSVNQVDSGSSSAKGNGEFWSFLCGAHAAQTLGISDTTPTSLGRFDDWYFRFYSYLKPFLTNHVPIEASVLEVGLGFGTLSQWLGSRQVSYVGIDIAKEPVRLAQSRLTSQRNATAIVADALRLPFRDHIFDCAISIGALHHTGDFRRSIRELSRVVRPGGIIVGMVYSVFSARNLLRKPTSTLRLALKHIRQPVHIFGDATLRAMSDTDSDGNPPPSTEFFSRRALRDVLSKYGEVHVKSENLDELPIPVVSSALRKGMLSMRLGQMFGLDLYFVVRKSETDIDYRSR